MTAKQFDSRTAELDSLVPSFHWHVFEVGRQLPAGWIDELLALAAARGTVREFQPTAVTTAREAADETIPIEAVDGDVLAEATPWIPRLYRGAFRLLGAGLAGEEVYPSANAKVALSLNVQRANAARYPCHVDSNPLEGLLYLTDCTVDTGGELVVGLDENARSIEEVDADCTLVYPRAGQLLFFDARRNPHYVRPLRSPDAVRAVVTMNYYSASCPETARPDGLDDQLFVGDDRAA
ncbi:2OG-Fe(II) oxygenase [Actinophytocola sp.]|uniref:2OG-Fe(II) oxygenase n=1 Tax=Actinophytocola sp. TaxID=1872138 RepID=UPI002EDA3DA7